MHNFKISSATRPVACVDCELVCLLTGWQTLNSCQAGSEYVRLASAE